MIIKLIIKLNTQIKIIIKKTTIHNYNSQYELNRLLPVDTNSIQI